MPVHATGYRRVEGATAEAPLRALLVACLLLALVPPLLAGFLAGRYAVDVPVGEQWSMIDDLLAVAGEEWSAGEVIRSQGGDRIATSRLILVPLGLLTAWDTRYEVALNWVVAGGLLLVLAAGFAPGRRDRGGSDAWAFPALAGSSAAVFSLAQWENWLSGAQLQVYLAVLFAAAALLALSASGLRWSRWSLAAALAVLASFSQAPGLAVWPAGLVVLAAHPGRLGRRAVLAGAWAALAAVLVVVYLQELPGDAGAGRVAIRPLEQPVQDAVFALAVLGTPVIAFTGPASPSWAPAAAAIAGGLLLAVSALLAAAAWRRGGVRGKAVLFPLGLLVLALGMAVETAWGSEQTGRAAAMASRHVTLAVVAWAATIALAVQVAARPAMHRGRLRWAAAWAIGAYLGLLVSSVSSIPHYPSRHAQLAPARQALEAGGPRELLARLHPDVRQVTDKLPVLRHHRLSVFRPPRGWRPPPPSDALASFEQRLTTRGAPGEVPAGASFVVPVEVLNPGTEEWPATGESAQPVNLAYRWIPVDGGELVVDGRRTSLPRGLAAGESTMLPAEVEAPSAPGSYTLRLSMVQETVDWFVDRGAPPLDLALRVVPPGPGEGAP